MPSSISWPPPAGVPSGSGPIVSESLFVDATAGWFYWTLPTYIPMASGQQYGILIKFGDGYAFNWAGNCTDAYAGGAALLYTTGWQTVQDWQDENPEYKGACLADFAFRTYMTAGAIPTATPVRVIPGRDGRADHPDHPSADEHNPDLG